LWQNDHSGKLENLAHFAVDLQKNGVFLNMGGDKPVIRM